MPAPDAYAPRPFVRLRSPRWTAGATIYQINTRQFTEEGTLAAARRHLPRLAELGVAILWLRPVHEIGRTHRKGALGSPYAVRDHYSVSSELGTVDDLRAFVADAHALGMKVILDWVANHTAWDCVLMDSHPEWYLRTAGGDPRPAPWWDWDDIVELDYDNPELRRYMTGAMVHWVREADIDGYRCDVAGFVPVDFWAQVRRELEEIKDVFMLAEWEARDLHADAFDATYAWTWNEMLHRIAHGDLSAQALRVYYSWGQRFWPREAMRMTFVSNHDKNSWEGTEFEQFGDALPAAMVLSFVGEGIPLVYNGQEAGSDKRLDFFDRDAIAWRDHPMGDFLGRLVALKRDSSCLANGAWGAPMTPLPTDDPDHVLSFERIDQGSGVLAAVNLSPAPRQVDLGGTSRPGTWRDWSTGQDLTVGPGTRVELPAWGYLVLVAPTGPATAEGRVHAT